MLFIDPATGKEPIIPGDYLVETKPQQTSIFDSSLENTTYEDISTQSILDDLDKILQLSTIFNTSTDLLLKDELEIDNDVVEEDIVRVVKLGDVNEYLKYSNKSALKISLGTVFCILSPLFYYNILF